MPLPEDDDHIAMIKRNGKPEFATHIDQIKFFKLVGETIFDNLDKINCKTCGNKMSDCTCNNGESCPDCGFLNCVCDPEDDSF